jgi:hypothetical protein
MSVTLLQRLASGARTIAGAGATLLSVQRNIERRRQESLAANIGGTLVEGIDSAEYSMKMAINQWNGALALSNLGGAQTVTNVINGIFNTSISTTDLVMTHSYRLPLPNRLVDVQNPKWVEENVTGTLNAATAAAMRGLSGIAGGVAADASSLAQVGTGNAINEFLTQMFKGPSFKKYTFTWVFSPNDPRISSNVKSFLKTVNASVAPKKAYDGLLWEYPYIFQLQLLKKNDVNPNIYKFKPAICTNISIDYSGSGVPTFYPDGHAETISLTMSFTELVFWSREDYEETQSEFIFGAGEAE